MKKQKNNQPARSGSKHRTPLYRRPWLWIMVVICLVAIALIFVLINSGSETETVETHDESSEEATADDTKLPQAENEYTSEDDSPEPKVTQYEGGNPNQTGELTGSVSSKDISGDTLTIMTNVDQYLNGTCRLEMRGQRTGDTYDISSRLSADVSTSYCEPFKIPLSALMNDYYEIVITLSGNNKTGTITDGVEL